MTHRLITRVRASTWHRITAVVITRRLRNTARQYGIPEVAEHGEELVEMLASVRSAVAGRAVVVVDVGAHTGKFASAICSAVRVDQVLCFEPNSALAETILGNTAGLPVTVHSVALSAHAGTAELHVHSDSTMSSLRSADQDILNAHFPWDAGAPTRQAVPTAPLDDYYPSLAQTGLPLVVKIDTQGNELDVIAGGPRVLTLANWLIVEFMFLSPYERPASFIDFIGTLAAIGFECRGAISVARRPSGDVSAVDFLFVRVSAPSR